jgi:hypothetical protein
MEGMKEEDALCFANDFNLKTEVLSIYKDPDQDFWWVDIGEVEEEDEDD